MLLTALNEGKSPVPDAAKPMVVFEFVQLQIAPFGVVEKTVVPTSPPHIVMSDKKLILAKGAISIVIAVLVSVSVQAAVELITQLKTEPSANDEDE